MTDSRMMRFFGGRNGEPYTETTAGMDGGDPIAGEAQGLPNDELRRWMLRRRRQQMMGMQSQQMQPQPGVDMSMVGGVTPIQWEDTSGGGQGGGSGGISRLFSMFGGGQ